MEFRILGPLEVLEGDRPVPLGGARQRALLALLLIRANEVVSGDRLVDELWRETSPESAANALQAAVSRLRRALQTAAGNGGTSVALRTRPPGYVLELAQEAIDAARFERLAAAGRQALADGEPAAAAERLAEALALWRGPALADFTYEPFAQEAIARLEELRLATVEERIEAELACGRDAELVAELEALVARNHFRERLRAHLMLALYRSGRQSEALAVYRSGRKTLADELGIEPGPQLRELQAKILRQEPSLLGSTLAPPRGPAPQPPAPQPPTPPAPLAVAESRKTVTVAFADLADWTAHGERLDPEALQGVQARYFELARAAFHRHGGTVEKFIGDAVLAVFGIPALHEDDALRAVRAAVELASALAELNAELEPGLGVTLALRVGITTGEVVAAAAPTGEALVTGDPVNTAARLQQTAGPGEILLGEMTWRLVNAAVEAEPLAALALKGKHEPVPAWRVRRLVPGAAAFARRLDTRFVGREPELALLQQAFERAVAERSAYLFTVLGAPGIGKTRLALEFATALEGEATVLTGRCLPYGEGITYWPLRELLHSAFGDDVRAAVEELMAGGELASEIAGWVAGALGLVDTQGRTEDVRWSVRRLLEELAAKQPLLVILEDLHWAEPAFLDLVEHVAELATDAAILLLCLARPELLEERAGWGGGKRNATTVELEPLGSEEAERLLEDLVRSADPAGGRHRIMAAAEGNPLFLEQIVAMVDEQPPHDEAVPLPPSIHALLAARLEHLGPGERAVLQRAAIAGIEFDPDAVTELLPEEARPTLTAHLEALIRKRFIRPVRSPAQRDAYRFRHVLIQETAYRSLAKRTRATLHQRFAEWLEETSPDRTTELEEILAYHLEQACRLTAELGPVDDGTRALGAKAAAYLAAAADRALARGEATASVGKLERAIALLAPSSPERLVLLPRLGDGLHMAGDLRGAASVLDEAIQQAERAGDHRTRSYALIERMSLVDVLDPDAAAGNMRAEAEAALRLFKELRDERGLAAAWRLRSQSDNLRGRWASYREANERALVHARRAGDEDQEIDALASISLALSFDPTPVPDAIARCAEIQRESPSNRRLEAGILRDLGFLLGLRGQVDEARDHFARSAKIYEDLGLLMLRGGLAMHWGHMEQFNGNLDAAERELRRGKEILEPTGERSRLSTVFTRLASTVYAQGRFDEAERLAETAQELGASDDIATVVEALGVRAKAHARRGETDRGEAMLREALDRVDETDLIWLRGVARMDLAELNRLAGRPADAIRAAREALALFERKRADALSGRAKALLSELG